MRIGIDARCLLDGQASGVGTYTRGIIESLIRIGSDHTFVLFSNSYRAGLSAGPVRRDLTHSNGSRVLPAAGPSSPFPKGQGEEPPAPSPAVTSSLEFGSSSHIDFGNYPNVQVRKFRIPNKLFHASVALFHRPYIDQMIGGVDVMFFPNIHFVAVSPRVPVVSVFFDVSYLTHHDLLSLKRRLWHQLVNPVRLAQRSAAIVTLSDHSKENIMEHFGVSPERVQVIPPGVSEPPGLVPEKERGEKYIVVLSDLEPRKNIDSVIEAVRRVNANLFEPVRCVILGREGWNAGYVKMLQKLAEKNPYVEFRGYVSEQEKWRVLAGAQAFVYVSFEEGFGFPPLEAMRVGTPVIASSLASLPEVLGSAAVYVNPYDVNEIVHAFSAVLSRASFRSTLSARGIEQVKHYSWDRAARATLQLFQHVGIHSPH